MFDDINKKIEKISHISNEKYETAVKREDILIKPPHSLGVLEDIACRICAITEKDKPELSKKRLLVFASDNGVFEEGVSSCPQNITVDQTINLTRGITGASSMAMSFGDSIEVYDLGVNADIDKYISIMNKKIESMNEKIINNEKENANLIQLVENKVIDKKISFSTKNIKTEAAMSCDELEKAINIGIEAVKKAKDDNIDILGVGEMGIGNTTTSTACLSLLMGIEPSKITGRGAGLTDNAYKNKIKVIEDSIERAKKNIDIIPRGGNQYHAFHILKEVGGYDIAAMVGAYIGAAYYKIPIVVDGLISIVAACLAVKLNTKIKEYIFVSHESVEPGYKVASDYLGFKPMFNLNMRLGEGSGCIIAFRIIDSAMAMHNNMKTFDEVNIDDSYLDEIR